MRFFFFLSYLHHRKHNLKIKTVFLKGSAQARADHGAPRALGRGQVRGAARLVLVQGVCPRDREPPLLQRLHFQLLRLLLGLLLHPLLLQDLLDGDLLQRGVTLLLQVLQKKQPL